MDEHITVIAERGRFEMCPHWLLLAPNVSALAIRLYLVLRKHADSNGECYPSRQRLAAQLGVSLPTLDKARQQLVMVGAIRIDQRKSSNDSWSTCGYVVYWEQPEGRQESLQPLGKNLSNPSKESWALTNTQLTNTQELNTLDQPSNGLIAQSTGTAIERVTEPTVVDIPKRGRKTVRAPYSPDFEEFWRIYPRRVGKRAAYDAYREAISTVSPAVIATAAQRYADDPNRDPQYTAHPTTWLRQERWHDDPLPARSESKVGGVKRMDNYAQIHARITGARKGIAQ